MLCMMLAAGCSSSANRRDFSIKATLPSARCRAWVAAQGGLVADAAVPDKLHRAAASLLGDDWPRRVAMRVIDSDVVAAYAWPRRHIFVTRGMLERVPDDELTAALAHELGHLIDDGHVRPPLALTGPRAAAGRDLEARADAIGCALLVHAGHDPDAMTRLLHRMRTQPDLPPRTRQHLAARLRTLDAAPCDGAH